MSEEIKEIIYDIKDSLNETPKKMYKYNKITFNLNELFEILKYVEQLENIRKKAIEYVKSKEFAENFPYVMNECQVRSFLLNILNKGGNNE